MATDAASSGRSPGVASGAADGARRRRALSPVGRGFLRGLYVPEMNMPESNITAVAYFDKAPSQEALINHFEQHIWPLERFSSLASGSSWVPVKGPMDCAYHFAEQQVADEAEIDAFAQSVMATPLSRDHPLWLVRTLRSRKGRSALIIRIHHVISDGIGLLFAFLPVMGCKDGELLSKIRLPAALLAGCGVRGAPARTLAPAPSPPSPPATSPSGAAGANHGAGLQVQRRASSGGGLFMVLLRLFGGLRMFIRGVLSILTMKQDSELKFNAPMRERTPFLKYGGKHVFTRMPPVPLNEIKAVRTAHGCTFNDAVMAALAGAFRRYAAKDLNDPLIKSGREQECKAFMLLGMPRPVNLRDTSVSLANNILTPAFKLPVSEPSPAGRLRAVVERCNDLKSAAYIAGISLTTKLITSVAPVSIMRKLTSEGISKCTCNVSNMPFPEVPTTFAGAEMKEVQVLFVNNIPQVTMLSYNGFLYWNMVSDPARIPSPAALGRYFLEEFAAMASDAPDGPRR